MTETNKDREAFEAWYWGEHIKKYPEYDKPNVKELILSRSDDGRYLFANLEWIGYQAALSQSADRIAELKRMVNSSSLQMINSVHMANEALHVKIARIEATIAVKDEALLFAIDKADGCGELVHTAMSEISEKATKALALAPSKEVLDGYVKSVLGEPVATIDKNAGLVLTQRGYDILGDSGDLYTLKPAAENEKL